MNSSLRSYIFPIDLNRKKIKSKVIDNILVQMDLRFTYVAMLIAATIISCLGLLQNSTAVVIGAMIISPIFWPIMGIGVSFATTSRRVVRQSLISFATSLLIVVTISMVIAWLTPTQYATPEVLARTSPNLLDLGIALASAAIGALALIFPAISTATGVAISISLLPPLSVVGIGLANGDWSMALGAFLLFFTNMIAIMFSGMITFRIYGLVAKNTVGQKRYKFGFKIGVVSIVGLALILGTVLFQQVIQSRLDSEIKLSLTENVKAINDDATATVESIFYPRIFTEDGVQISALVTLPENDYLTERDKQQILDQLTQVVGKTVDLQLTMVNTVSIRREENEEIRQKRKLIDDFITQQFEQAGEIHTLEKVEIEIDTDDSNMIDVYLTVREYDDNPITIEDKENFEKALNEAFPETIKLHVDLLSFDRISADGEKIVDVRQIKETLQQYLQLIDADIEVLNVKISKISENEIDSTASAQLRDVQTIQVEATLFVPSGKEIDQETKNVVIESLSELTISNIELILKLVYFDKEE